ncbi:MAG: hypothetical protein JO288_06810 [Hyphomicrobiales bacterium]|nr:hypothetical protein [Hyphomicrobiales bacterium]
MTRPQLYISYGVPKSASTFLYQIVEEIIRMNGCPLVRLGPPFCPHGSVENYIDPITGPILQIITERVGPRDVVLKTHSALPEEVKELIEAGQLLASAVIRDPREIALSMLDHGRRSRRWGHSAFAEYHGIEDTIPSIDAQFERFLTWERSSRVVVFTFNQVCFETRNTIQRIAQQLSTTIDASSVLNPFKHRRGIGQFNKGAALRYHEMDPNTQEFFLKRYAPIYKRICFDTPAAEMERLRQARRPLPERGELAQSLTNFRRYVRDRKLRS